MLIRRCRKCKNQEVTLKIDAFGKTYAHCLSCGYAWPTRISQQGGKKNANDRITHGQTSGIKNARW